MKHKIDTKHAAIREGKKESWERMAHIKSNVSVNFLNKKG